MGYILDLEKELEQRLSDLEEEKKNSKFVWHPISLGFAPHSLPLNHSLFILPKREYFYIRCFCLKKAPYIVCSKKIIGQIE